MRSGPIGAHGPRTGKAACAGVWWSRCGLFAVLVFAALVGCSREPAEQALRRTFFEMQAALERRDAGAFLDSVAEDFAGEHGMGREELGRLIRLRFLRHSEVGVTTGPLEVELSGDRARLEFSAVVTGGSGRLLPEQARHYAVETGWRFEDGRWMLIFARWE